MSKRKYTVKTNVFIQGTLYKVGDTVELTQAHAEKTGKHIELILSAEEKAAADEAAKKAANDAKANK